MSFFKNRFELILYFFLFIFSFLPHASLLFLSRSYFLQYATLNRLTIPIRFGNIHTLNAQQQACLDFDLGTGSSLLQRSVGARIPFVLPVIYLRSTRNVETAPYCISILFLQSAAAFRDLISQLHQSFFDLIVLYFHEQVNICYIKYTTFIRVNKHLKIRNCNKFLRLNIESMIISYSTYDTFYILLIIR